MWHVTRHARQRLTERAIDPEQLARMLRSPDVSQPSGVPDCRTYIGGGLLAIVNEARRRVITVGPADGHPGSWEPYAMLDDSDTVTLRSLYRRPTEAVRASGRRPMVRKVEPSAVASRNVLDDVHPGIRRDVLRLMRRHQLTYRAIRIKTPTHVEVRVG